MKPKYQIVSLIATLIFGIALGWFVTWKNQIKPLKIQYEMQQIEIEELNEYLLRLEKVADKLYLDHQRLVYQVGIYEKWLDIQVAE